MDNSLFNFIYSLAGKWWPLDWLGIFFASYLGYFLILFATLILFKEKNRRRQIYAFSLTALSIILARGIIAEIIRFFNYRSRPFLVLDVQPLIDHSQSGSFPSGHAAAFFALALAVFYFNRKWGCWIFVLSLFMGLARIFVGVHWPSDILAGVLIGLASVLIIKKILPEHQTNL